MFPEAQTCYDFCEVDGGYGLLCADPTQMPALYVLKDRLEVVSSDVGITLLEDLLLVLLQMCT